MVVAHKAPLVLLVQVVQEHQDKAMQEEMVMFLVVAMEEEAGVQVEQELLLVEETQMVAALGHLIQFQAPQ